MQKVLLADAAEFAQLKAGPVGQRGDHPSIDALKHLRRRSRRLILAADAQQASEVERLFGGDTRASSE